MGKRFYGIAGMLFLMLCVGSIVPGLAVHASPTPRVEVVFCLDTTGSMSGEIREAKQRGLVGSVVDFFKDFSACN